MATKSTGDARTTPGATTPIVHVPDEPAITTDTRVHERTSTTPDTTRIGGLLARAPNVRRPPPTPLAPQLMRSASDVAARVTELLSLDIVDWAVTDKEARQAIDALRSLGSDAALAAAVDLIDPKLLTRLEKNLPAQVRTAYAETVARVRDARNAPSASADPAAVDDLVAELRRTLDGFLQLDLVTEDAARTAVDRLRRLGDRERDHVLDALGPSKAYRMIANLSKADAEIYAPTVAVVKQAFFGRLLRDAEAIGLAPQDKTAELETLLAEVAAKTHRRPADMKDYVYFLVPGLVTEHQPGYMDANATHLENLGLDVHRSQIDTDADVATNAATLRREIAELAARTGKKVVLISHSKGGPDAAEALQDEATEQLVHRFIPMQPACATPVASTLMDSPLGAGIRGALTSLFGAATGEALADLAFDRAKERFYAGRPLTVPVLALASTVGDHFSALRAVSDLIRDRYDTLSDGLVTLLEQFVASNNAFRAVLDGVDHAAPCSAALPGAPAPKYDQGVLTEALVVLALRL